MAAPKATFLQRVLRKGVDELIKKLENLKKSENALEVLDVLVDPSILNGVTRPLKERPYKLEVIEYKSGKIVREMIPAYIRIAMRCMYDNKVGRAVISSGSKRVLRLLSHRQGKVFDKSSSAKQIRQFIETHGLRKSGALEECERPLSSFASFEEFLSQFRTFNEFFHRSLQPKARLVAFPDVQATAVVPADCRLSVFSSLKDAMRLWIKGKAFSVENVFTKGVDKRVIDKFIGGSLVIARLAPQDYHRWHIPTDCRLVSRLEVPGALFTVNPIAIRRNIDVFSRNKREVFILESPHFGLFALVVVGATMVGSIKVVDPQKTEFKKGECHGYFSFGGSTILLFFQKGVIEYDEIFVENSKKQYETLVNANQFLGRKPEQVEDEAKSEEQR